MAKVTIFVKPWQKKAAQTLVRRSAITGRPVSPEIRAIANAKRASQADETSPK